MALDTFNPYLFVSAGEQSNKYLTPTITNGIAQFQAQRAQSLTGLTVRIDPIQEGTGDPSPTNVRAISGRTGLTAMRCGKNLLQNIATTDTRSGVTYTVNSDGTVSTTGTATASTYFTLAGGFYNSRVPIPAWMKLGGQYIISSGIDNPSGNRNVQIVVYDTDGNTVVNAARDTTFTVPENAAYYGVFIRVLNGTNVSGLTFKPMIRAAGTSDTFEPYTAQTYPISWQTQAGTVYGGTLNVTTGVLTVDWDYIASYNGETLPGEWISDRDVYAEGTTPTTGAEVAYKIAEPVTYQLDPEDVMTLAGFNQIYSDAGPVIDIQF